MGSSIELYHRTVGFDAILGGGTKPSLTVLMLEENITYISPLQQPRMYWLIWVSSKRKNSCPRMSAYKLKKGGSSGRGRGWGSAVALRMAYYRSRAQLAWCASFSPSLPPIAFLCCLPHAASIWGCPSTSRSMGMCQARANNLGMQTWLQNRIQ